MTDLSRYLRPRSRSSRWMWVLALLLASASGWLGIYAFRWNQAAIAQEARNEALRKKQAIAIPPVLSKAKAEDQKRWAALKYEIEFPWKRVFQAIESSSSKDIELLEFVPDKQNRNIVLRGEAKHEAALEAYLESLAAQSALKNVHLVHQMNVTRERLETVSFEIKAAFVE